MGIVGPASICSFFGVGGDENPGFSNFPASKSQLVTAAGRDLEDGDSSPGDLEWLSRALPERTYQDRGEALAALSAVISWAGNDPSSWIAPLPMHAVAVGSRLVVGSDQVAALVARDGRALDSFGPGEHIVTRETAPGAAAQSRRAGAGFPKSTISATPFFASTRETRVILNRTGRTRSGETIDIRASVTCSIASLPQFLAQVRSPAGGISVTGATAAIAGIIGPSLDQTLASHDASELVGSSSLIDQAIRSGAAQAGLRVSDVTIEPVRPTSVADRMAAIQEHQRQAMAHLYPETQAMIQAQMAKALERAQASRGSAPGGPATGAGPGTTMPARTSRASTRPCPSCHASNPPDGKFCGNCGKALA